MAKNKVYFGTRNHMRWVKPPATDTPLSAGGWSSSGTDLNGGGYAQLSPTSSKEYQFTWGASPAKDIYDITDYRTGAYGTGLLYYLDPFAMQSNALSSAFSLPSTLCNIGRMGGTYSTPTGSRPDVTNLATNPSFEASSGTVEVRRNLATNPSFEASSGTVEVRRNLHRDPRATSLSYWGKANEADTVLLGNGEALTTCRAGNVDSGLSLNAGTTLEANAVYTVSADVEAITDMTVRFVVQGAGITGNPNNGSPSLVFVAGEKRRISFTFTANATGGNVNTYILRRTSSGSETWKTSKPLIEKSAILGDYFDGSYSPDSDLTPSWTGTANGSASVLTGKTVVTANGTDSLRAIQSDQWAKEGLASLRQIPLSDTNMDTFTPIGGDVGGMRLGMGAGKTYTVLATCRLEAPLSGTLNAKSRRIVMFRRSGGAGSYIETSSTQTPNEAGEHELRLTFTLPADTTEAFIRLYHGGLVGSGDLWWDSLTVVEGVYNGTYFDGNTSPDSDLTPSWVGAVNASASVLTAPRADYANPSGFLAFAYQSSKWAVSGNKSLCVDGNSMVATGIAPEAIVAADNSSVGWPALAAGKTYTVAAMLRLNAQGIDVISRMRRIMLYTSNNGGATYVTTGSDPAQNVAGEHLVRWTFTIPADSNKWILRLSGNGSAAYGISGDACRAWWDGLTIVEGNYPDLMPFDGNTPDGGGYVYAWTGSANASTSTRTIPIMGSRYTGTHQPLPISVSNANSAKHYIPCPPMYRIWVAHVASTSVLRANGVNVPHTDPSATSLVWKSYSDGVELQYRGTGTLWGTAVLVLPAGKVPPSDYEWQAGKGNSGLRFSSEPQIMGITAVRGGLVSGSVNFKETGLWE